MTDAKGRTREPRHEADGLTEGAAKDPPGTAGEDEIKPHNPQGDPPRDDVQVEQLVSERDAIDRHQPARCDLSS